MATRFLQMGWRWDKCENDYKLKCQWIRLVILQILSRAYCGFKDHWEGIGSFISFPKSYNPLVTTRAKRDFVIIIWDESKFEGNDVINEVVKKKKILILCVQYVCKLDITFLNIEFFNLNFMKNSIKLPPSIHSQNSPFWYLFFLKLIRMWANESPLPPNYGILLHSLFFQIQALFSFIQFVLSSFRSLKRL